MSAVPSRAGHQCRRWLPLAALLLAPLAAPAGASCGTVATVATQGGTTTRYAYQPPDAAQPAAIVLVLLPGGGGHVDLDEAGCPRALLGNQLVRTAPAFRALGFHTALVDARSDMPGEDGLAGLRIAPEHAEDIGRIVADVRARSGTTTVWLVGNSRGAISAANAAARLAGPNAADGVVLASALMSGQSGARKPWVAQSVFDLPLEGIKVPLLVVGHADDTCLRSPPKLMPGIAERAGSARKQVVAVSGGPGGKGSTGLAACEGKSPHGFIGQEEEVVAGIARFVRGERY